MTTELRVHPRHIRAAHLCMGGARAWAARYGLDWGQLVREGWSLEAFEATGCHLAAKVAEKVREEASGLE